MFGFRNQNLIRLSAFIVLATIFVLSISLFTASPAFAYDDEELAFLSLINNYRNANGLPSLSMSWSLFAASKGHSNDMAVHNFFSHTGSNGTSPWDRIRAAGYTYNTWLGENIAAGLSFETAAAVFEAWRNSASHNANMLSPNFRAIGIARVYYGASAYGYYWTTDFGGVSEDVTAPTVTIPYPTGGTKVSGTVAFTPSVWDNIGILKVDLYIDGTLVATRTQLPYSYSWDTTGYSEGPHTLRAVVADTAGYATANSISVTVDNFNPTKRYYFTWYDQSSADWFDWVLMANPTGGLGSARTAVSVGDMTYADRDLTVGAAAETPSFPGVIGGPVAVETTQPLIASQRVVYKNSFNEIPALADTALESTYYFTWYDSNAGYGMNGNWILIGNQGAANANVNVYIGGVLKGTYTVAPGDRVTPLYPNVADGPVMVTSTNGQPLIVSQRVLFKNSFSEVLGVPASKISSEYNFTWYDFKAENFVKGNWILIGNEDTRDAQVDVYIGGNLVGNYTVPQGGRITPAYPEVIGGPVRVVSTNGKRLIVSQRVIFKDSFEEVQGITAADQGTDLWFTWYDSRQANGIKGNWILVSNSGNADANIEIYINGALKQQVTLASGENLPLSYNDTIGGPVRVLSTNGQPLIATQRVLYKDSFNEIVGMKFP